ncbi:CBS domain-containing protein [Pseudoduganella sp. DS3]|uniref:CBS domain-containing protein n=1 Tax=Pseudoduganella guangdongensis TaxID=2692179 RepID=A0A6N9HPL8_9BURK|nr:HPP family protein [Pseudoduganella guangdongensis]MYN04742.1 CBS domain-containing protein [Pseudoduganella guangdongensis]
MLKSWLTSLLPARSNTSQRERLRASAGALLGLALTSAVAHYLLGDHAIWLVAPMGASAVLLFCLPASPLAQPWSVIGGNVVSGLMGAACVQYLGAGPLAAALATPLAIAAMFALRCLHPPGGATALMMVIGGPAVHALGYRFALGPVLLDCVLMVLAAMVYNNLSGRRYPHQQQPAQPHPHATNDAAPTARFGFQPEDLDAVLRQYNQVLDISRDDLQALFLKTEERAYQRRFGIITCGDIMSKDVVTAEFATPLAEAWREMRKHRVAALPVLNRVRRVIGIVTTSDFMTHGGLDDYHGMRRQLREFLRPSGTSHSEKPEVVGQIMVRQPRTANVDTPITELVPLMADSGFHHIPVLDHEDRFAGIVTQSDVLAALYARNAWTASASPTPSSYQGA